MKDKDYEEMIERVDIKNKFWDNLDEISLKRYNKFLILFFNMDYVRFISEEWSIKEYKKALEILSKIK